MTAASGSIPSHCCTRFAKRSPPQTTIGRAEPHSAIDLVSLEQFLSQLPELWRKGEVRATHEPRPRPTRYWRIRADPFEAVWGQVLLSRQEEPDATAKPCSGACGRSIPPASKAGGRASGCVGPITNDVISLNTGSTEFGKVQNGHCGLQSLGNIFR